MKNRKKQYLKESIVAFISAEKASLLAIIRSEGLCERELSSPFLSNKHFRDIVVCKISLHS